MAQSLDEDSSTKEPNEQNKLERRKNIIFIIILIAVLTVVLAVIIVSLILMHSQHDDEAPTVIVTFSVESSSPTNEEDEKTFADAVEVTRFTTAQSVVKSIGDTTVTYPEVKNYIAEGTYKYITDTEKLLATARAPYVISFLICDGAKLHMEGPFTVEKYGNVSPTARQNAGRAKNVEGADFYGTNSAFVVCGSGSYLLLVGVTVTANAQHADAFTAIDNAKIKLRSCTISGISYRYSIPLHATLSGSIYAHDCSISTTRYFSPTVFVEADSLVELHNTTLETQQRGSALFNATGSCLFMNVTGSAAVANIGVVGGGGAVSVVDSKLEGQGAGRTSSKAQSSLYIDNCGVLIHNTAERDTASPALFRTKDSTFTITTSTIYESTPLIYVTNAKADIIVTNCVCTFSPSSFFITAEVNEWGEEEKNGGIATIQIGTNTLTTSDTTCDRLSSITVLAATNSPSQYAPLLKITAECAAFCAAVHKVVPGVVKRIDSSPPALYAYPHLISSVTSLIINNQEVTSLVGIEYFTELTSLNIANNDVDDLTPLQPHTKLTSLLAFGNLYLADISPILIHTQLRTLSFAKCKLVDSTTDPSSCLTQKLSVLTNLVSLDVSQNLLAYTTGLNRLTHLQHLNLFDNVIHDFTGLAGLVELQTLNLAQNNYARAALTGLETLEGMTQLTSLSFHNNFCPTIGDYLHNMNKLETLQLNSNSITDVSPLSALTSLRSLVLATNSITRIDALYSLPNIEILYINSNRLAADSLNGIFDDSGSLVWKRLKKLEISSNTRLAKGEATNKLISLDDARKIELGYTYAQLRDYPSTLPHTDANGVKYVTYEDFGARCDGVYDDFIAMTHTHEYANANKCEVHGTPGKTYHIYKLYTPEQPITTNVNWNGAKFVIHDEEIEELLTQYSRLFIVSNVDPDFVDLKNPGWTINKATRKLAGVSEHLATLNSKGYQRYHCQVFNENKKQFIRVGASANDGSTQQDSFIIDREGNLEHDVQWDFDTVTSFQMYPIPATPIVLTNLTVVTLGPHSMSAKPVRRVAGKSIYAARLIRFYRCNNIEVSHITHTVEPDEISSSYSGFFYFATCSEVYFHDCVVFTRKVTVRPVSTYDINTDNCINIKLERITTNDIMNLHRWGVHGSNFCKQYTVTACTLNRVDAHQGVYDLTVTDSTLRLISVAGQHNLIVRNVTFYTDTPLQLRSDYGATWTGTVRMYDIRYIYWGVRSPSLVLMSISYESDGTVHDFGYELHFPEVYIEDLKIDYKYATSSDKLLRYMSNWAGMKPENHSPSYWSQRFIVNRYSITNAEHINNLHLSALASTTDAIPTQFIATAIRTLIGGEDVSETLLMGESVETTQSVFFELTGNNSCETTLTVYKDGTVLQAALVVTDTFTQTFTAKGSYRINIRCAFINYGATGEADLNITIK